MEGNHVDCTGLNVPNSGREIYNTTYTTYIIYKCRENHTEHSANDLITFGLQCKNNERYQAAALHK